jgi:hypothetical protein
MKQDLKDIIPNLISTLLSASIFQKSFTLPPTDHRHNYFKDDKTGVEYSRSYAQWKCGAKSCANTWFSSYTWISFPGLKSNSKLTDRRRFSGAPLKESDYLQQFCRNCLNKNNKIIHYENLKSNSGNRKPHKATLCAKCCRGDFCQQINR